MVYLEKAKEHGDVLVVAVTIDKAIKKGIGRPVFNLEQRMAMVRALSIVDVVIPSESGMQAVELVRPDVYAKGKEYEGRLPEQKQVEAYGGRVVFTDGPVYSSSKLLTGGYLRFQGAGGG